MSVGTNPGDALLRTGEAAGLLGCSRQHVVDLCERGALPSTRVGSHRRVRLSDVMRIAEGSAPEGLRREQQRNLLLHVGVAGEFVADPDAVMQKASENLALLKTQHTRGQASRRFGEWEQILEGPVAGIVEALTSPGERSIELRQNSPFAGVLAPERRLGILEAFQSGWSDDAP